MTHSFPPRGTIQCVLELLQGQLEAARELSQLQHKKGVAASPVCRSDDLGTEPPGPADEGIFALIEAKPAVSGARNPDARADADRAHRSRGTAKPERASPRAKINAIEALVYAHRGGKSS